MGTSFHVIYERFLSDIGEDYDWSEYTEEELQAELLDYLNTALANYKFSKRNWEDRDNLKMQFNFTLTNEEIQILSEYMVIKWKNVKFINKPTLLKQALPSKDFQSYSQANHLDKLIMARESDEAHAEKQRSLFSYADMDIAAYKRKK